ncbi:hypothetical protein CFAM422_003139 [Trichoderma lentiforme]|uniref:Uncharacterized protein n=1 Tax=Trichoderma lentiforme TaxID=1567552 RepID=A0A9P4XLG7_9HYPO|nr:hypothetical protein CFAM422_003139 [Trichoderma lentiforme]
MIKEIFIDTNPILLGITAVVSVAHKILETLAFGSDIAHYRKKKDNIGISVCSILANVFMQDRLPERSPDRGISCLDPERWP